MAAGKTDLRSISRNVLRDSFIQEEASSSKSGEQALYPRLSVVENDVPSAETADACRKLAAALALREKYVALRCPTAAQVAALGAATHFQLEQGVFRLRTADGRAADRIVSAADFFRDYGELLRIVGDGPVKTLAYQRLKLLELKFAMHQNLNAALESDSTKEDIRDFHNIVKVDTHVHLAAAMTASHLLSFIKQKLADEGDAEVNESKEHGRETLRQVFARLAVNPEQLTTDSLDVHGDNTFQRFDNFNNKYNPFGFAELRLIFLKSSNLIDGRYFAELTQQLLVDCRPPAVATEYRVSVYGRSAKEWDELADWAIKYRLSCPTNRWLIQVPRIYNVWHRHAGVASFEAMLANVFQPLFEVTLDPASHPSLHEFLKDVSGFDSVDDESKQEIQGESWPTPDQWTSAQDPPYAYYMYYIWANIATLNALRVARGYSTFNSRPHCGESGDVNHLAAGFLVADGINHGINLRQSMPLQYLYYLAQLPIAVSPLSNNSLFLDYAKNPFNLFFQRGLFVSLSTDDPLQFHYTQNPLIEEYSVASQHWGYNAIDLSELARNSVLMSGFEHATKCLWIGPDYDKKGVAGNNIAYTNVPDIRISFREETLDTELDYVLTAVRQAASQLRRTRLELMQSVSLLDSSGADGPLGWTALEISSPGDVPININKEGVTAVHNLVRAKSLRKKYVLSHMPVHCHTDAAAPAALPDDLQLTCTDGVYSVDVEQLARATPLPVAAVDYPAHPQPIRACTLEASDVGKAGDDSVICARVRQYQRVPSAAEFAADYAELCRISEDGPTRSWTWNRLKLLEHLYSFHKLANKHLEKEQAKRIRSDFYQLHKVDPHVHLTSAMHPEHFLVFVRDALADDGDAPIRLNSGAEVTLRSVFAALGVEDKHMTVDSLGMTNYSQGYHRFDSFREKGNPFGSAELREIFLSYDNGVKGKYLGRLTNELLTMAANNPQCHTEYRITVSGRHASQWTTLADWAVAHDLIQPELNAWVVQLPRNYHTLRADGHVLSFGDMLRNFFEPLFAVTLDPQSNPALAALLTNVAGVDSVGDESLPEPPLDWSTPPDAWTSAVNPPYPYYLYYMWANLAALNNLRKARGLNVLDLRPHAGAAGDPHHLCAAFLLATGVSHGLLLHKRTVLQYLFYLQQIPVYCSPMSENGLYMKLEDHPFIAFFRRGLSVALCTDNPLHNHFTAEPLLEEYAIAAQVHSLSPVDLAEIALNSVLASGFSDAKKRHWLGENFRTGNHPHLTNLPPIRHCYRKFILAVEKQLIQNCLHFFTPAGEMKHDLATTNPIVQKIISLARAHSQKSPQRATVVVTPQDSAAKRHWKELLLRSSRHSPHRHSPTSSS